MVNYKGNVYKATRGKSTPVLILTKNKTSALNKFKKMIGYKYSKGKPNISLVERNRIVAR